MKTDYISVYMTASSREEADKIAHTTVTEKLAACANIIPEIHSTYRWQGKVENATECAIILKTTTDKFDALQTRIKQIHSYECPCIVATPITAGNPDFLDWVKGHVLI